MYAYLVIERRQSDCVSFPDGSQHLTAPGAGEAMAAAWRPVRARGETVVADEAALNAARHHAEWKRREDAAVGDASSPSQISARRAAFRLMNPEPPRSSLPVPEAGATPAVSTIEAWSASLSTTGDTAFLGTEQEYPDAAVAARLSELEREGWSVTHVSEQREVQHADDRSTTTITAVRLLLHNPSDDSRSGLGGAA